MPSFRFSDTPDLTHQVQVRADSIRIDGTDLRLRSVSSGCFTTPIAGRSERLYAVALGDTLHVQLRGQAWKIERVDPARSAHSSTAIGTDAGASHAPMPGVVVSVLVTCGQPVRQDEALLVIESMKMQMTICSSIEGTVVELPLEVGQTFQRRDLLARVQAQGADE